MDIYYVTFALFPTKYAHAIHMMKMCEAFANNGHNVTLIIPDRNDQRFAKDIEPNITDLFEFYGVNKNFKITEVALPQYRGWKYIFPYLALKHVKKSNKTLLHTRHTEIAAVSCLFGINTLVEYHHADLNGKLIQKLYAKLLNKSPHLKKIILISQALKNAFIKIGFKNHLLLVAPDGSSLPARADTIKPPSGNNLAIGYIGSLFDGKGMEIIIPLAKQLPQHTFHVVGGMDDALHRWKELTSNANIHNILYHGFIPYGKIPAVINSLDVCLLPNQKTVTFLGNSGINISDYTSPLKMFDYMAHGKPIVASDLPVLREVLNEQNAILCNCEDVNEWAAAISKLAADPQLRENLGKRAREDFENNYTWNMRAKRIAESVFNAQ